MRTILFAALLALVSVPASADPHWHGHGGWHDGGNWILPGIVGGVIGGLLRPAPPPVVVAPMPVPEMRLQPWTDAWYTFCAEHYRTFDAHTGFFQGFDGQPHFCAP